jgi:hypothetical protein
VDSAYELEFLEHDNGRGYVVVRRSDGQRLRWETLPRKEGLLSFNVVGAAFHAAALQHPSFAPGLPLKLRREPENPYDPQAVSVWNADESLTAGYLAREDAAWLTKRLDGGEPFGALAMWEILEAGHRVHLRILLLNGPALARGVSIRP